MDEQQLAELLLGATQNVGSRTRNQISPMDFLVQEAENITQNTPSINIGGRIRGQNIRTGDGKKDLLLGLAQGLVGDYLQSQGLNSAQEEYSKLANEFLTDPMNYQGENERLRSASKLLQFRQAQAEAQEREALSNWRKKEIFKDKLLQNRDQLKYDRQRDKELRDLTAREDAIKNSQKETWGVQNSASLNTDYSSSYPELKDYLKRQVELGVIKSPKDLREAVRSAYGDIDALRKEFSGRDEIKKYSEVKNIYKSMQENLKNRDRASDLDFVYGVAKILDPGSVVRESEGQTILLSTNPIVSSNINKIFGEVSKEGLLTAENRKALINLVTPRVKAIQDDKQKVFDIFSGISKKRGYDASSLGDYSEPLNFDTMIDDRQLAIERALASGYTDEQINAYLSKMGK